MAITPNSIVTAQAPLVGFANLSAVTGLTSRGPITGTTGTVVLAPTSTNGQQISSILVKGSSTSQSTTAAQLVYVWEYDGTTSWLVDEITITAVTPSTSVASFYNKIYYSGWVIPATHAIYVSTSITTTASTTAMIVQVLGGLL